MRLSRRQTSGRSPSTRPRAAFRADRISRVTAVVDPTSSDQSEAPPHGSEHEAVGFDAENDLADRLVSGWGDEEVLGDGADVAKPLLKGA